MDCVDSVITTQLDSFINHFSNSQSDEHTGRTHKSVGAGIFYADILQDAHENTNATSRVISRDPESNTRS